MIQLGFA
jgi:hypothetical protein